MVTTVGMKVRIVHKSLGAERQQESHTEESFCWRDNDHPLLSVSRIIREWDLREMKRTIE